MSVVGRGALAAALALATASCGDSTEPDAFADKAPPRVTLLEADTPPDSGLAFTVDVQDNLGIKAVHVRLSGGLTQAFDTTLTSANSKLTIPLTFAAGGVAAGPPVEVVALAIDGANNESVPDTLRLAIGNLAPPSVHITSPTASSIVVAGKSFVISLSGRSALQVKALGYEATGAVTAADSTILGAPADSAAVLDTLTVPAATPPGTLTLTPFVIDGRGTRVLGPAVAVNVQTAGATGTKPVVSLSITPRLEVTDTLHVEATDQTGITSLGFEVLDSLGAGVIYADSAAFDGNFTAVPATFKLRLPITTFPTRVLVRAFARNGNGTREYARGTGGVEERDTVTIVAGVTRPLPNGGQIADAYYHLRKDRLYLTNIERNRLEVFAFRDSSFKTAISVGSRPWGIAPWPTDRAGTAGDTLLVANSGGTNISYVSLNSSGGPIPNSSGAEVYRYPLPNIIPCTVTTETSATTGQPIAVRTCYDFSDRPQFLATTCGADAITGACGDRVVVYSTTPTGGESVPFSKQGTIRWENLTRNTSHFFFEQAVGQLSGRADTLEVTRYAAQNVGRDETIVPYIQWVPTTRVDETGNVVPDSVPYSVVVQIDKLAFRDTTFVRNSGNFRRTVIGEGGAVLGSRAIMYDVTRGMVPGFTRQGVYYPLRQPVEDAGVSRWGDVTDFISNDYATVKGVAINFDGELAAIRGDSTALIDATLRQQGLMQTSGGNPGFDFHPLNAGLNSTLATRLAFAASSRPEIEIYDTFCYQQVATVPVRDPIIGPIKSSIRPNGQIVLVGATARGVVIVSLPDNFATGCPTFLRARR
jgi:hypothetical protein